MSLFLNKLLTPARVRNFQDGIYALLVIGVSVSFMLFLLGSTDLLSSLTAIGLLLCLCLVGGTLRFFSMTRVDGEIQDRQDQLDQNLNLLQHRIGDHDLTLLKMAGQIEGLETDLRAVRLSQQKSERQYQDFMNGMKDRMLKLVTVLTRSRSTTPPLKKDTGIEPPSLTTRSERMRMFFPPIPAVNINQAVPPASFGTKKPITAISAHGDIDDNPNDDDVYVSPPLLRDAIDIATRNHRIDVYMQPIVALPHQKIVAFDLYGRVRLQPGVYIPARQYRGFAVHEGKQNHLDRLVLREVVMINQTHPDVPLFVNMTLEGLMDTTTLTALAQLIRDTPQLRDQLVINLSQKDLGHLTPRAETIIKQLITAGLKFGINDVQTTEVDLNLLARLKFSYLKLAHNKLVTTTHSDPGAALTHRFLTRVMARQITMIASQIDTRDHIRPLLDYPITWAQGYAFGRPDRPIIYKKKRAA